MTPVVSLDQMRPADRTCVWMDAGVLAYRLCDRCFDCEHCPLDAALRGIRLAVPPDAEAEPEPPDATTFPGDRLYTTGHTWLMGMAGAGGRARFGIDSFALAIVGPPRAVRPWPGVDRVRAGQTVCTLELDEGELALGAPVAGRIRRWNPEVGDRPSLLATDPYGEGWLAELAPDAAARPEGLVPANRAHRQADFDLRRYRRRVAFELLAASRDGGPDGTCDGRAGTDLRRLLGARAFLAVVRDLIR